VSTGHKNNNFSLIIYNAVPAFSYRDDENWSMSNDVGVPADEGVKHEGRVINVSYLPRLQHLWDPIATSKSHFPLRDDNPVLGYDPDVLEAAVLRIHVDEPGVVDAVGACSEHVTNSVQLAKPDVSHWNRYDMSGIILDVALV